MRGTGWQTCPPLFGWASCINKTAPACTPSTKAIGCSRSQTTNAQGLLPALDLKLLMHRGLLAAFDLKLLMQGAPGCSQPQTTNAGAHAVGFDEYRQAFMKRLDVVTSKS